MWAAALSGEREDTTSAKSATSTPKASPPLLNHVSKDPSESLGWRRWKSRWGGAVHHRGQGRGPNQAGVHPHRGQEHDDADGQEADARIADEMGVVGTVAGHPVAPSAREAVVEASRVQRGPQPDDEERHRQVNQPRPNRSSCLLRS